ncbi:MAG TPA: LytR C-terminal domain-containing protein [Gaiellaceae bacterium]|nr:LytR C-terminal domain-containing protein [Gaiellaceae bacterium]
MEHAQPLERSIPWRAAALVALAIAALELVGLLALAGVHFLPRLRHAVAPAATSPVKTHPVAASERASKQHLSAPATPLRPRSRVTVLVLNGNGVAGAAGREASQLLAHGYRRATPADAPSSDYARSLVLFRSGWAREARRLAHDAGIALVAPLDGRLPAGSGGAQLVLILGR